MIRIRGFQVACRFNCGPNSNSGILLARPIRSQVETDSIEEPPSHHTGGVYGFLAASPELPRKPERMAEL